MLLLDANIPMYVAGRAHRYQPPCVALCRRIAAGYRAPKAQSKPFPNASSAQRKMTAAKVAAGEHGDPPLPKSGVTRAALSLTLAGLQGKSPR